ncbi:SH3 domain-containing protein [Streptomyces sp. NPDC046985]|uniref:SH3 domain-containing protein n=1 Tax=Streptomyces sp. NPDC046985 TaxID=3155377 RepID=UPI0033D20ADC
MIRRTLTGGLLAAVTALALVPSADAATAAPAPRLAASATAAQAPVPAGAGLSHRHRRPHYPVGRVVTRGAWLSVHSGPGAGYRVIGYRRSGSLVGLACRTYGSWAHGAHQWYRLAHVRGYVSARYVRFRGALPWC